MCLWNTDAAGGNKVKNLAKSLSPKYPAIQLLKDFENN